MSASICKIAVAKVNEDLKIVAVKLNKGNRNNRALLTSTAPGMHMLAL